LTPHAASFFPARLHRIVPHRQGTFPIGACIKLFRQLMGSLSRRSNRGTDNEVLSVYNIPTDIVSRHAPLSEGNAFECRKCRWRH
jgi:hypothetical protein